MNNFRVGQRVALTTTIDELGYHFDKELVCTVAEIGDAYSRNGLGPAFRPAEIDLRGKTFNSAYWRPVVEKSTETGMAILRKLLEGAPIRETVYE